VHFESIGFKFLDSPVNLGAGPNFLRAFLVTETEFLWILGDDDLPTEDSLEIIEADISGGFDLINYEFNDSGRPRKRNLNLSGDNIDGYLRDMDHLAAAIFISINIYRVRRFSPFLRLGYDAVFSGMPYFALTLAALQRDSPLKYLYSNRQIVKNGWESTPAELRWNWAQLTPRFASIFRAVELPDAQKTVLRRKVFECLDPKHFTNEIIASRHFSSNSKADFLRSYLCDFRRELRTRQKIRLWFCIFALELGLVRGSLGGTEGRLD
jgi:hypothetical protein